MAQQLSELKTSETVLMYASVAFFLYVCYMRFVQSPREASETQVILSGVLVLAVYNYIDGRRMKRTLDVIEAA